MPKLVSPIRSENAVLQNCVCVFFLLFASNAAFDHQFWERKEIFAPDEVAVRKDCKFVS